jgi:AmmeMemoRadiSam system protein B
MTPDVRPAAVAGTFYPGAPTTLRDQVDAMLRDAQPRKAPGAARTPKAIIAPHAGYQYSGPVAASVYATLQPARDRIRRVVLVGPSHRVHFAGLALPGAGAFETPLGTVHIDAHARELCPALIESAAAHAKEHSLEVQIPFLQRIFGSFSIVPLLAGEATGAEVAAAIEALWGSDETVIVVSSDLSHYLPYDEARVIDGATARHIVAKGATPVTHDEACGATPINGLLVVARSFELEPEIVDLRNSGDTAGGRGQVVGYGAFAFHEEARHGEA